MFRCPSNGYGHGQPHSTTNYHRTHSDEHVTKVVAQRPCHAGGAVLQHHVVHKESFKEDDGGKAPANRGRCFDNYPMKQANNAMPAANYHGGGSHHRYKAYEETYEESREEETTYAYGVGGGHRFEYETHEETYEEEEEEVVVGGGGGGAQLRRGYRCA